MTHEEVQTQLNEYLAKAFNERYTLAEVVGALEESKHKLLAKLPFGLSLKLSKGVYGILSDLPVAEALGMAELTKLAVIDNVITAVTHKKNLANTTNPQDGKK